MKQYFLKDEIVNVNLGSPPKETKGHEQSFERPCVIIKSFDNLELAVIVPLTTKQAKYSLSRLLNLSKGLPDLLMAVLLYAIKSEQFLLTELLAKEQG